MKILAAVTKFDCFRYFVMNMHAGMFISMTVFWLVCVACVNAQNDGDIALGNEMNENLMVNNDYYKNEVYKSHIPKIENFLDSGDLMSATKTQPSITIDGDEENIMKRNTENPSMNQIYSFIYSNSGGAIANEKQNLLTATATSNTNIESDESIVQRKKRQNNGNPSTEMKSIFSELKSSNHHKLTRSDIRQLAKKAVMLATLKTLKEKKKSTIAKPKEKRPVIISKPSRKHTKNKHTKKNRKHRNVTRKSEMNIKKTAATPEGISTTTEMSKKSVTLSKDSEMAEDLSQTKKKSSMQLSDDTMSKTEKPIDFTPSTKSSVNPSSDWNSIIQKKSTISQIDNSVENIFDGDDSDHEKPIGEIKTTSSETPLPDKVLSIKTFLEKADPTKIPNKFLPDLPAGLRMIGWKELIEKKKKQLGELETAVGVVDTTSEVKPVTVNIDVDQESLEPTEAAKVQNDMFFSVNADKKHDTDPLSIEHVGYLQRHIQSARALRKLIAKTLVGHCKSTGQRILDAFVAMDKALARAQTIASVIGKKFNVDADRIDALVGDKEDQVVETFLKDIFTKI